jgi:hypothetical protein
LGQALVQKRARLRAALLPAWSLLVLLSWEKCSRRLLASSASLPAALLTCHRRQGSVTTTTPYGPHPADFLSNVRNFKIIESTLREGEQFANAFFNLEVRRCLSCAHRQTA